MALAIAETHEPLRPRNISVPSYRPTQKGGCTSTVRQLGPGSGEGQHMSTVCGFRRLYRSGSRRPINRAGSGPSADVLMGVQRRNGYVVAEHGLPADPLVTQLGRRLAHSAPLTVEERRHIEHRVTRPHVIDRPGQFLGEDR